MKKIINEELGLSSGDRVVIKVGSNVLAGDYKGVNLTNLENLVDGISYLMEIGLNVVLVSSGAVAVGKYNYKEKGFKIGEDISIGEKAKYFKSGWGKLESFYRELFDVKNIISGGILLTHDNFSNGQELSNIVEIIKIDFKERTLSVINENDIVSRKELSFGDNDNLSGFLAKAIKADLLIILSDIDGIYKNFKTKKQELVGEIRNSEIKKYYSEIKENSEDSNGTGGSKSKLDVMQEITNSGITGLIANGNTKNILQSVINGEECKKTIFRV